MTAAVGLMMTALAIVWLSRRSTGDLASPVAVVLAAWCGTLALFELRLVSYLPLERRTVAIVLVSLIAVVATLLVGQRLTPRRVPRPITSAMLVGARAWLPAYAALGLAGMAWYVWNVKTILGWSAFADGSRLRLALGDYTIPSQFLFLQFFCVATPLVAIALALAGQRLRWFDVAGAILCTTCTWLSTDRTQFFTVAVAAFFAVLYIKGPALSLGRLAMGGLVVALALVVNFTIVARWVGKTPGASIYVYATASYAALNVALHERPAYTGGAHAFYPIARLLERLRVIRHPLPTPIFGYVDVTAGQPGGEWQFNGYTWLNYPYQDWGVAGVVIYVSVIGLAGGVLYGRLRADRTNPVVLLLMAQYAMALAFTPFVNKFNNTASWYIVVLTTAPFLAARSRARRPTA